MKRNSLALGAAVLITLILGILLLLNRSTVERLRTEADALKKRLAEAEEQRVSAGMRGEEYEAEMDRLRAGQAELLRLRGEVSGLRREASGLRQAAAEAAKASKIQTTDKSVRIPESVRAPEPVLSALGRDLADVGAATPENAVTTFMWAATNGRLEKIAELVEPPEHLRADQISRLWELISNRMSNQVAILDFLEINKIRPEEDGTLGMQLLYRDRETGKTNPFGMTMRQHEAVWKVVFRGVPKDF